ncbi:MAG: hypothetical protein AAFV19_06905 [Pseudomonadota bacterium]
MDETGRTMIDGDFDGFARHFSLPLMMETFEGKQTLDTIERLKVTFDGAYEFYTRHNVKELYRHCVDAQFRDPETIESTHESRVISHGVLIIPPFPVFSVIRRFEDCWKIIKCSYAVSEADDLNRALLAQTAQASV